MDLPEELQHKIMMMSIPSYKYITELKQVHILIKEFSEEYEDDKVGLILWFDHARTVRGEPRGPIEQEYYLNLIEQQCIENGAYRW